MKTTIVPAQITTIEDKIAGSLSLSQLLLLAAPIFIGSAIYIAFPPFFHSAPYKIVLIVSFAFVSSVMSIRFKGKILLQWAVILLRYNLRPRYYLFDKNDLHLREQPNEAVLDETEDQVVEQTETVEFVPLPAITAADSVALEQLITDPAANMSFRPNKRGGIDVRFAEVER